MLIRILSCLSLYASASAAPINSVMPLNDVQGHKIRSAAPHVVKFGTTWYMYGVDMTNYPTANIMNVTCYSSTDLSSWTLRDTVLTEKYLRSLNPASGVWPPRVLYNAKNKEYVLIARPSVASWGLASVYTSNSPTGRFVFRNTMTTDPLIGDLNLFTDTDGKVYLIYNKGGEGPINQRFAYIYQLNDDYYSVIPATFTNTNAVMEGFGMVKYKSTYFLFGSQLTGWDANDNFYITAPTPLGPWTDKGLFIPKGSNTYNSQTWHILEVSGSKGTTYVYIGDRWVNFKDGRQIWLPLEFNSDTSVAPMKWYDQWFLDTAGAWSPEDNPSNLRVPLRADLSASTKQAVTIQIFDIQGKALRTWQVRGSGYHQIAWEGIENVKPTLGK